MTNEIRTPKAMLVRVARVAAHAIFWGWNAVFLAIVIFGIAPQIGLPLLAEAATGMVPPSLVLALISVVLTPIAATALGALRFRREPEKLGKLFYGVEVPCFLLALGRLFLVRDMTPGVAFVIAVAGVAVCAFLYRLLRDDEEARPRAIALSIAGDTTGLAVATYAAALLSFFALPIGVLLIGKFLRFDWFDFISPMHLLGVVFFGLSATLFAFAPPMMIALYVHRFVCGVRAGTVKIGARAVGVVAALTTATLAVGFGISVRQPQHRALALLASPPVDDADRRARLASENALRDGLTNAYLAPYRYLGSNQRYGSVHDLLQHGLDVRHERALAAQHAFDALARPFVYDGDDSEPARRNAGDLYAGFFDRSIQHGEKDRVLGAIEATYSRQDREAGLLAQGERKVHVARQEIRTVSESSAIAEIEIHEAYENRTTDPQEVLYFFSLPETAAVTGLWLGETERREEAFAFTISPRGAAQRVYRAEVSQRRDPALIEQVGPRQYRLRAFPIPARERPRAGADGRPIIADAGRRMHLWLRYRVLADEGGFPLPRLIEARNAFRDRATERLVDGREMKLSVDAWLPRAMPASAQILPREERARIDDHTVIIAHPEPAPSAMPRDKRFAVVLDRSYSMRPHADRVTAALAWVKDRIEASNDVDLYLTSAHSRGEPPQRLDDPRAFDPASAIYYGGQDPAELLEQLDALRADTRYDGIVVVTDEGGFDLAGPKRTARDFGAPVWMVHVGGELAPGYDDATLATIQARGGGATTAIETAFARLADVRDDPRDLGWADGYRFTIEASDEAPAENGFSAIAAHRWIPLAARSIGLDDAHRVAKSRGVVSPFSSMIVLVNDAQRKALADAEAQKNRFDRETETGETRISTPFSSLGGGLTGTPEPEEWILMGLAALGLVWAARRRPWIAPLPA